MEYTYKVTMRLQLNDVGPQYEDKQTKECVEDSRFFLSRPDTQRFLEKLKKQQEAKQNAEENDNRPFVLKYVRATASIERKKKRIQFSFF